jgi:hypothetical protein
MNSTKKNVNSTLTEYFLIIKLLMLRYLNLLNSALHSFRVKGIKKMML